MRQLPVGNNFQDALEIKEESEIEIPEGFFVTKNLYLSTQQTNNGLSASVNMVGSPA